MLDGVVFKQIQHCIESDVQLAYEDWFRQIDRKRLVVFVFLNFSSAFDIDRHELLLMKLMVLKKISH